jgi:signal peptidase II
MTFPRQLRWLWLTLAVVLLDRASKAWVESQPNDYFPHTVIRNIFEIVFLRNPGIAFSLFAGSPSTIVRILLIAGTLVIIGLIAWLLVANCSESAAYAAGLALILAGATGNLTDRILHGAVTDFLKVSLPFIPLSLFNPWPTFNFADSAVTVGAILVVFDVLFHKQHPVES